MPSMRRNRDKSCREYHRARGEEYRRSRETLRVTIDGPDADRALAALISNAQYDGLDVTITIDRGSA